MDDVIDMLVSARDMDEQTLEDHIKKMGPASRRHFKQTICTLALCYGDNSAQAVIIIGRAEDGIASVTNVGCDEMQAAQLMVAANEFFGYMNTVDAPPKENFN